MQPADPDQAKDHAALLALSPSVAEGEPGHFPGVGSRLLSRPVVRILLQPGIIIPVGGALAPWAPLSHILIWIAACFLACALEYAAVFRIFGKGQGDREPALIFVLRFIAIATFASFAVWAWVPDAYGNNLLIVTILLFLTGCSITLNAHSLKLSLVTALPFFAMLMIMPWIGHMPSAAEVTMIVTIFVLFFGMLGLQLREKDISLQDLKKDNAALQADLYRTQGALLRLKVEVEAGDEARRDLLTGLAEDIRLPLKALVDETRQLKSETGQGGERVPHPIPQLHRSIEELSDLAADLADLVRVEVGTLSCRSKRLDLPVLLNALAQELAERLRESQIVLEVSAFPDLPNLFADEQLVRRMVFNLVTNALHQTPPGGHVTLAAFQLSDGGLGVRVSNSGAGISEEELEHVFASLVAGRTDLLLTEKKPSLSLTVVKVLAELHGANFSIRSRLGMGSQATVHFPAERLVAKRPLVQEIASA